MSDLISRQAAIDALGERPMVLTGGDYELGKQEQYVRDLLAIENVPSAQPRPKTGHWIYDGDQIICNRCFKAFGFISLKLTSNYCPNCGAKMDEEENGAEEEER